jgi:ATP-binding cassette subfamily C (CFTR/MRP) protein 4
MMEPGLFGMALSLLIDVANLSSYFIKMTLQMDLSMQSTERVLRYTELPEEAPAEVPEEDNRIMEKFDGKWPKRGEIIFHNVFMKYDPKLPYVLQGLNFTISPGMKVGCVGRTGAGKSSIVQVLFRMFEIEKNEDSEILIDRVDIRTLGLETLRRNLSIIPQTATIFTGTIRRNLDPFSQYPESKLWEVLKEVNLKQYVESLEKKLDTDMSVSTTVFSAGQKQLVCLARAILRESKIIILDEATANVDIKTDNFIQEKVNEKFKSCTVLTIAHRLTTIAHYDRILVMDKGKVAEYDNPYLLLVKQPGDMHITNKEGIFAQMVMNTGKSTARKIFEIAASKYKLVSAKKKE